MFINCIMIENTYHGSISGMATNTHGRVDQLEDRYLGMVEAPSSNLGTSTSLLHNVGNEVAVRHTGLRRDVHDPSCSVYPTGKRHDRTRR